ncbi:MAG TPA: hypothetical protein VFY18_01610 [Candidatus Limnocylindrales bacterium]|nr:hypothetical protein [Candidatus Limnocylindrales bacterium]
MPVAPGTPVPALATLGGWAASSTIAEAGTMLTATYESWPLAQPPHAYACPHKPDAIFDEGRSRILLETDPRCVTFAAAVTDRRLQISIDRAKLPHGFDGLEAWTVVMAVIADEGTWSLVTTLPAVFPKPVVKPAPSVDAAPS